MTAPPGDSEDHHPHAPNLAPATPGPARRRGGARLRRCASAGFPALRMAVNLSGSNLGHPDLVAANLELELTESVAIAESVGALATLQDLKALGLHLAIDDFGTGYSALSRLRADNRHGIGEVEPRPLLADLGGRQVDGEPACREGEPGVADRRPNALPCLLDGPVGEADDGKLGSPLAMSASTTTGTPARPWTLQPMARESTPPSYLHWFVYVE